MVSTVVLVASILLFLVVPTCGYTEDRGYLVQQFWWFVELDLTTVDKWFDLVLGNTGISIESAARIVRRKIEFGKQCIIAWAAQ